MQKQHKPCLEIPQHEHVKKKHHPLCVWSGRYLERIEKFFEGSYTHLSNAKYDPFPGYELMLDTDENIVGYVHERTGELIPAVTQTMPDGSQIRTPEDKQRYREYVEREQKKYLERNTAPHFYFATSKDRCGSIKPQTLARIFFLATYLEHGRNELYRTERTLLKKSELPNLMKLSRQSFFRFWSEVEGQYFTEREDGALVLCDDFFREALGNRRQEAGAKNGFQKVFIESLRQLYWQTSISKHKYLGYLFMVLPYINWQWNVLCQNPEETDLDKVVFMTIQEFCEKVNCNPTKPARVAEAYKSLSFIWNGKQQHLCSYLEDRLHKTQRFVINPEILYRGEHPERVMALGMFFPTVDSDIFETAEKPKK